MASPPGVVAETNGGGEKGLGPRVASFGALLVSNAPSPDEGQGGAGAPTAAEPHLYTTSAEGTFHSMQGAVWSTISSTRCCMAVVVLPWLRVSWRAVARCTNS